MKKSNHFFICFILAFSSACLKKDKGATSSGSTTTGSGQTGGGDELSFSGGSISSS